MLLFLFSVGGVFFSAPGQTFLISLAIPAICQSLQISEMNFATCYSIATLAASLILPKIGHLIDTWPGQRMIVFNGVFFGGALAMFASSSSLAMLLICLFFMRLFGQGALTLTASSHTIKQFTKQRALALSVTQLGYPLSEFIFPSLFFLLLGWVEWRGAFLIFSIMIIIGYCAFSLFGFLHPRPDQPRTKLTQSTNQSKSLRYVLNDRFFPFYVALSSIPPIMMTAAFYFQVIIFESNQWDIMSISIGILCYALTKFIATIFVGPIIDRNGVVLPLFLLTLFIGIATCMIAFGGPLFIGFIYYAFYGIGIGASATTMNYLWSLLYGANHIGEIKGFIAILRNGGTAISPVLFSFFLYQLGVSQPHLFLVSGLLIIGLSFAPFILQYFDVRIRSSVDLATK